MKTIAATLTCLLAWLGADCARAHEEGTSFLSVQLREEGPLALTWDVEASDLIWSVFIDSDHDGVASAAEIDVARPDIGRAVTAQIKMSRGGAGCRVALEDVVPTKRLEHDYLSLSLSARCPSAGRLEIGGPLFLLGDAQRVLFSATRGAARYDGVLSTSTPTWHEPARFSAWPGFGRFVREGVWHVIIGFDHIAFILLLLLPSVLSPRGGRWQGAERLGPVWRDLVFIVTAFTLAHSTTLALAATGLVTLPSRPVEIAIAASIAVAAVINLMPRLAGWRLPIAFGFGLVHGFGFANVLGEVDAGGSSLAPLLAGFNIGVELAQLGIIAIVLPLIYLARRSSWYTRGLMPLGSCALGAAGLVWLVQRI
jgi:hypothetical protein